MRVFVAGGTGVIGRRLVPQLVARGHQVTATTTSAGKLALLEQLGAEGVVMDGLDAAAVGEAVATARPDAIVNQMTALSVAHAGKPNPRTPDRFFATTNRLRSEGIDHLLAAAEATGVPHFVAQGHASMNGIREGGWVKTEEDPLEVTGGTKAITPPRGRGRQGRRRGPALRRVLRARRQRRSGRARAEAAVPARRGRHRLLLLGASSTTRRALPSWRWSRRRRACSTSSMTSRPRSASGCPISRSAQGRSRRGGCPGGWRSCWPAKW